MIYFIIAAFIVLCDQLSKYFLTLATASKGIVELIPGFIRLNYTENTGMAFSFLPNMRWLLVGVTAAVILVIAFVVIRFGKRLGKPACFALAFVLGGALSNLIDRALFGHVADFFDFEFIHFAVFNVADICITLGGIAFCLFYIFHPTDDGTTDGKISARDRLSGGDGDGNGTSQS